ncbi:cytochrome P450 [Nemania sp. FL0916]|nr:cytochrome P450 [Nemania sp. FL0916]
MTGYPMLPSLPTVALLLLIYFVCVAVYRLYFHPLSKFPGPRLAAITDLWELYQDYIREESGHLFLELDKLHERYGPIVRIRPNEVHPRDRDPLVGTAIGTPQATIGTGPYELHRMRKAAISPFFSSRAVGKMEADIQAHATKLFDDMETRVGEVLDLRVYFLAWTTDFITGAIFHKSTDIFWDAKRAEDWFAVVFDFSGKFPLMKHLPWLVTTGLALPLYAWRVFMPSLVPFISVHKSLVDLPIEEDDQKDIFETILASTLPLKQKQPKRMANEVFNLLIAGSLTTSKTAMVAVFHLLDNPSMLQKLRTELLVVMPDRSESLDIKTLQKLPILDAVIKETMRIGCVVTTRFPMIAQQKALRHRNVDIPAGSSISMTFCKAAIDPAIFADPYAFRPERWLDGSQKTHDYDRFVLPFGRGSRICVGQHLSYAQLYILLGGIFRRIDMQLFETTRGRDIEIRGGGPLGEPTRLSKGMRVKIMGVLA